MEIIKCEYNHIKVGIAMLMMSANSVNYNAESRGIYTRDRQLEHRSNLLSQVKTKKISQGVLLLIIILASIMLFFACAGMLYFKSVIAEVQMDINDVNSEIRIIEQDNSRLMAEMINAVNIDSIRISASSMGMTLPQAYQVEHVDMLSSEESTALYLVD